MALRIEQEVRSPSFEELNEALACTTAHTDAAETHGLLCGLLCACGQLDQGEWLARVLDDDVDGDDRSYETCRALLKRLEVATMHQLQSADCSFQILVPADSETLTLRSQSLVDWCTGFLAGVGLAGGISAQMLPNDSREILQDMAEITRLDATGIADEEGQEAAYAELVEYLRVGTLILHEELQTLNPKQALDQEGC